MPCFIDIIKHPRETDGKSTAIHASIIASESVSLYTFPDIPHYNKEENVSIIYYFANINNEDGKDFRLHSRILKYGICWIAFLCKKIMINFDVKIQLDIYHYL